MYVTCKRTLNYNAMYTNACEYTCDLSDYIRVIHTYKANFHVWFYILRRLNYNIRSSLSTFKLIINFFAKTHDQFHI